MGNEVPKLIADRDIERPCDQAQTLSAVERALLVSPTTMYLWANSRYSSLQGAASCFRDSSTPCRGMIVSPLDKR